MKIVSLYSFKGGAGRTTAVANLAVALAKSGKNVLAIDLDLDGPGLEIVLDLDSEVTHYLQDYLRSPRTVDPANLIIQLDDEKQYSSLPGRLSLIAANLDVQSPIDATGDVVHDCLADLLRRIGKGEHGAYDFCLLDSQSGYTDLSATVLDLSHHMFVLTKIARQHVLGTAAYLEFLVHLRRNKGLQMSHDVVISTVPEATSQEHRTLKKRYLAAIREASPSGQLLEIPEAPSLRWRERIIVLRAPTGERPTADAYRALATRCSELP